MKTIIHNGHKIEVAILLFEKVFYDGKLMSSRISITGGTHVFKVEEEGEDVNAWTFVFGPRYNED